MLIPLCLLKGNEGARSTLYFSSLSILGTLGSKPKNLAGGFKLQLICLPVALLIIALARPQSVTEHRHHPASGVDIILAIDVSLSMDTEDFYIEGYRVDRLTAARQTAINFIENRPNDRIGIVGFAGKPYVVSTLTTSHSWLPFMIDNQVKSSKLLPDGTAIGSAINLSSLRLTTDKGKSKSKIIVLLTDGESNSGKMSPLQATALAETLGIKIYTVAIGSESGRLPGRAAQNFDPVTLGKIAAQTGGQFFIAESTDALNQSFESINQLEKVETKVDIFKEIQPYHFYFSILALVILALMLLHQSLHLKNTP